MAYENLCMYCFKDMNGELVCPHCGGDSQAAVPQIQLLPGTLVYNQRFLVGRALGQDSGGIVYNALDTRRGGVIRIREYLPRNCAERLNDGSVVPIAGMEDTFETGMRKLHASVDSVEDPRQRHFYFEENGTAYIAQRKNAAPAPSPYERDEDDEADSRRRTILYIAIAAGVVLVIAVVAILFLNSLGSPDDQTTVPPLSSPSSSASASWAPLGTPSPSPSPTSTFSSLVDPELSWLEFTRPSATASNSQRTVSPSQPPTVQGNENYPTINTGSSAENIRALQNRLYQLGWLSSRDVTGRYDDTTRAAVRAFQQFVNDACSPAEKLAVDGIAGRKTQQWLYNSSVSLDRPTATPTPKVTAAPNDGTVDASSSASAIRALQNQLITLGLLPKGSADGRYGNTTQAAVRSFQRRVNELQGYALLSETGRADALTQAWLNYYVQQWQQQPQRPTATPTASPTVNPNIDASSSKERIREAQKLLQQVGLLSINDADGVYGSRTKEAVRKFQTWVNQMRGSKTLEVNGIVDPLTLRYLNYCVENGYMYELNTNAPATNPPTFEPEPDVTEVPPGYQAGTDGITADSPQETIEFMQEMLRDIGLLEDKALTGSYDEDSRQAVRAFQQAINDIYGYEVLPVSGSCDPNTLTYLQEAYDLGWNLGDTGDIPDEPGQDPVEEPTDVPTEAPTPEPEKPVDGIMPGSPTGEILAMQRMLHRTRLLNEDQISGEYDAVTEEAVRDLQISINIYNKRDVIDVTGYCDAKTLEYLRYADEHNMDLRKVLEQNAATPVPTEAPTPEPEQESTPEPTDVPTPEPTEPPRVGVITALRFYLSGSEVSGALEFESGSYDLSWAAEGELQSYYIRLYDSNGDLKKSTDATDMTSFKLKVSDMAPGEVYELRVGALPVGGSNDDIYWQSLTLKRLVVVTPEPTQAPTPVPSVSAPVIKIGSTTRDVNGIPYVSDETIIFSWTADGPVQSYTVNLYDEFDNLSTLGETSETSRTVRRDQLPPGIYRLHVGAKPVGGGEDSIIWSELTFGIPEPELTPEPVQEATPEPVQPEATHISYVDANSSADDIQAVQMALYRHGLLNANSVTAGTLDAVTLEAVAAFQQRVNEQYGLDLYVIDPSIDAYIDAQTLDTLLYQEIDLS